MSRYRKTMAEAYGSVVENSAIQMQIAALKKAYEPLRNKRISMDNANKLMKIMDKFDGDKNMLAMMYKADIPFVSGLASARLISKHNFKAQQLMQIRKEDVDKLTDEVKQIREAKEKDLEDFEEDLIGDAVKEGKMSEIDAMQKAGKSAAEIAKLMKLPVKTVKDILGEEEIHEFKKMSVTIRDMDTRKKAITDLQKQNLGVSVHGGVIKVDGKGKDLNNIAKDLMNFYNANVRAESYTIDEEADQHFYNPVTEACWVGYKQVGMKKKGDKMVPNCVPEEVVKEELEDLMEGTGTITGFRNDKEKSNMVSLAKQHGLKTKDIPGGIELSGNMRKILDMQLAAGSHLKKEDTGYLQSKLTGQQIKNIKTTWANKKASDVTPAIRKMIKNMDIPTQLAIKAAGINQLSKLVEQDDAMTMDKDMKKKKEELPKKDDVAADADTEKKESESVEKLKADLDKKDDEIQSLKIKAETEKAKVAKKETEKMVNPETGEPLLQVGIAYKHMKDKLKKEKAGIKEELDKKDKPTIKKIIGMLKGASQAHAGQAKELEKAMKTEADLTKSQIKKVHDKADELPKKDFKDRYGKEGDSVRYAVATNIVKKKEGIKEDHPAKEVYESIKAVKNKAKKSGMPYGILKKVYDRGMAAWRGGHRPGATQVQWALARVNSFVTKSSGTWGGADKDLAKQVRKESLDEASLYAFKEYEPSQSYEASRDMKNVEDAIKRAGGRIKHKEKPSRREPNASFEIETGNPNAVKAAIKKVDPEFNVD
tara:strand:+ start:1653 stop:3947 length:2295 start_codon:yes stop_codon:yes gene_type:complete